MRREKNFGFPEEIRHRRKHGRLEKCNAFFSRLSEAFRNSAFGRFICGYDAHCRMFQSSRIANMKVVRRAGNALHNAKYNVSRHISESRILAFIRRIWERLMHTVLRDYGIFGVTFSVYVVLIYIVKHFAISTVQALKGDLIFAAVLFVLSVPLLFSQLPLRKALQKNPLTNRLIYSRLGVRKVSANDSLGEEKAKYAIPFFNGTLLGLLAFFVRPIHIFAVIALLALLYMVFASPETVFLMLMFFIPLAGYLQYPTLVLCIGTFFCMASFIIKLIMGKRIVRFEPADFFVLLFMLLLLFGGVFTSGGTPSLMSAIAYTCLVLGYFIITDLFSNAQNIDRAVRSILSGGFWVALIAIIEQISGNAEQGWLDLKLFSYIGGRVTSTFDNPNILAVFIIMLIPFALALVCESETFINKLRYFVILSMLTVSLVFTWSRGAWLAAIISIVVFFLFYSPRSIPFIAILAAAIPLAANLLPDAIVARFTSISDFSDSSISYRFSLWDGCLALIKDHWLGGIGVGESAFGTVYPQYALAGAESSPHSHNLFLEIIIELGVVGVIIFACILFIMLQNSLSYKRLPGDGKMRAYNIASAASVLAVLLNGLTDYVWYSYRVFMLFWIVVGIGIAVGRVNRYENSIAGSTMADESQSASLDITLR